MLAQRRIHGVRVRWTEPSPVRQRLLQGMGSILIAVILARGAITGPASSCPRAPLHRGGDMVPGFCVDYGAAWGGWPLLLAGLLLLAIGIAFLLRAAGGTRFPVTLRTAIALALTGTVLVYLTWSEGATETCALVFLDSDPPLPPTTTCSTGEAPWHDPLLALGGAFLGAGGTLALAAAVRAGTRFR